MAWAYSISSRNSRRFNKGIGDQYAQHNPEWHGLSIIYARKEGMVCIKQGTTFHLQSHYRNIRFKSNINGRKVIYIHHSNPKPVVKFDLQVFGIHSATQPSLHARRSPRIKQSWVRHDKSHLTIRRKKKGLFWWNVGHLYAQIASQLPIGCLIGHIGPPTVGLVTTAQFSRNQINISP